MRHTETPSPLYTGTIGKLILVTPFKRRTVARSAAAGVKNWFDVFDQSHGVGKEARTRERERKTCERLVYSSIDCAPTLASSESLVCLLQQTSFHKRQVKQAGSGSVFEKVATRLTDFCRKCCRRRVLPLVISLSVPCLIYKGRQIYLFLDTVLLTLSLSTRISK